ncbi:hypothetical protein Adt_07089 [Abeliophyllum distichum]|uniref:Myb-like domain-containing protein n=1 Tax=Abeliophyllum distichum TaxID=126358 RepID=A0ABD1VA44_9LAMI
MFYGKSKLQGGRVPVGEALERSYAPWEEQAAWWLSLSGRGPWVKLCSIGGASCKVAKSQWRRLLSEAVLHGKSKLQGGRVPVEEALERSCASWEEQAARSPSGGGPWTKLCYMGGGSCKVAESQWERPVGEAVFHGRSKLQGGRVLVREALE